MSGAGPLRSAAADESAARDAIVRPLARAAERACVRPGCPAPARATLSFRYATREAWVERLVDQPRPESYDLCAAHAGRTRPPHGWQLRDRRSVEERVAEESTEPPADLGGERTVAVLAEALRAVPDRGEDAGSGRAEPEARPVELAAGPDPEPDIDHPGAPAVGAPEDASPVLGHAPGAAGDPGPGVPRPVPAARARRGGEGRRRERADDGPARHW